MPENVELLKEQLGRFQDVINSKITQLRDLFDHQKEVNDLRIKTLDDEYISHQAQIKDHEDRIRTLTAAITTAQAKQTILAAVQVALTIICSAIAAYLGASTH